MDALSQELADLKAKPDNQDKIAALESKQQEMKQVLAEVVQLAERYKADIKEKDGIISELQANLETYSSDVQESSSSYEQALEDSQREIDALQAELQKLADENAKLKTQNESCCRG